MMPLNRKILSAQIESGPEQLCPQIVANWARGDPKLVFEMARRGKHPLGIEAPFYPPPINRLVESATEHPQEAMLAHS